MYIKYWREPNRIKLIGVLIVVTACSLMGFALANEYIAKINK